MVFELVLTGIVCVGAGTYLGYCVSDYKFSGIVRSLNEKIRDLDSLKENYKYKYIHEKRENEQNIQDFNKLLSDYRRLQKKKSDVELNVDKNVMKAAAKKALFASHPDRGGNSEDFIKFNKLYQSLK